MSNKHNTNISAKTFKKNIRTLKESEKKDVASEQCFKCANFLGSNLPGLEGYECPIWLKPADKNPGSFDKSSYQIDHKIEFSVSRDDSRENLQALCPCCHAVKTKSFMIKPKKSTKCIITTTIDDENSNESESIFSSSELEIVTSIYKSKSTSESNSTLSEEICVTTIEELFIHSKFEEICVSNRKKIEGLIRFKGDNIYYPFLETGEEPLNRWIESNCNERVNFDKLITDILKKCFNNYKSYQEKYYEFVSHFSDESNSLTGKYVIVDLLNKTINKLPLSYKINYRSKRCMLPVKRIDSINTYIDVLLDNYVNHDHLMKFKSFCRSVFVENRHAVFYDYVSIDHRDQIYPLYKWICWLCYCIYGCGYIEPESKYNKDNPKELKKKIKNARVIVINLSEIKENLQKILTKYQDKNIIIITDDHQKLTTLYNIKKLEKVINDNAEIKNKLLMLDGGMSINLPLKYTNIEDIFERKYLFGFDTLWSIIS